MKKLKCPYCKKTVEGFSDNHVESQMNQHIMAKHKDQVRFKKVKGE